MKLTQRHALTLLLLTTFGGSTAVLAEVVPIPPFPIFAAVTEPTATYPTASSAATPAATPEALPPVARRDMMDSMRSRMQEVMRATDPVKRKELIEAVAKDMDVMAQMGQAQGMNMMARPGPRQDRRPGMDCERRDGARDYRLDNLEKRMDMMQLMLQVMTSN